MMEISERSFEDAIEQGLLQHGPDAPAGPGASLETLSTYGDVPGGYRRRRAEDYDRGLCLLPRDVVDFVLATQPREWQKLTQHHGAAVREQFLARLASEIARRGALDVLRTGIKDSRRRGACTRSTSSRRCASSRYSAKNEKSFDMVLFLNGIPIFTAELKNRLNDQDVEDAMRQYKTDRDPREPLLAYGRCLAHFAVDPDLVVVTTALAGPKTRFLPFNQGKFGGAGNPPVPPTRTGYPTGYLWEETWARDSVLDLIRQFIHEIEEEDDRGRKTGAVKDSSRTQPEELETLSRIIAELNERFGLSFGPEHRVTLGQMMERLDADPGLDASARVNTRENVRLTFDQKVEHVIQEIVDSNFELYKRITDDPAFGAPLKSVLFDQYLRTHRQAEELIKRGESKTLEFKSTLRWSLKEDRQDDKGVTLAVLKTVAAFLNTEGGDLPIGVADDGVVLGIERDQLETDDKFMRHLAQVVRNGLGACASTCIDPAVQIVQGRTVCVVSCQRSPEPVFLKWRGMEASSEGDFYVRSGRAACASTRTAPENTSGHASSQALERVQTGIALGGVGRGYKPCRAPPRPDAIARVTSWTACPTQHAGRCVSVHALRASESFSDSRPRDVCLASILLRTRCMSRTFLDPEAIRLPLDRVSLCLDCEVCFPIEKTSCPACGSRTSVPIAQFLNKSRDLAALSDR